MYHQQVQQKQIVMEKKRLLFHRRILPVHQQAFHREVPMKDRKKLFHQPDHRIILILEQIIQLILHRIRMSRRIFVP